MNIPDYRQQPRREMKHEPTASINEKVYPIRHCLMIAGAVLIVIDIGLFLGGIAVIAAGIDIDTYGFAAMIAISVLTMICACTSLICGCRARPPRSLAYARTSQHPPQPIPVVQESPKKIRVPPQAPPPQKQRWHDRSGQGPPPSTAYPPRVIRVQFQRPSDFSVSECSHNATYAGSTRNEEISRVERTGDCRYPTKSSGIIKR